MSLMSQATHISDRRNTAVERPWVEIELTALGVFGVLLFTNCMSCCIFVFRVVRCRRGDREARESYMRHMAIKIEDVRYCFMSKARVMRLEKQSVSQAFAVGVRCRTVCGVCVMDFLRCLTSEYWFEFTCSSHVCVYSAFVVSVSVPRF